MYPSYGLLSHVPTQSLFYTKIGMISGVTPTPATTGFRRALGYFEHLQKLGKFLKVLSYYSFYSLAILSIEKNESMKIDLKKCSSPPETPFRGSF